MSFVGITRVWRWNKERMEAADAAGTIVQKAPENVPLFERYLNERPGRPRDDVWLDVMLPE